MKKKKKCQDCAYYRIHIDSMKKGDCFGVEVKSDNTCKNFVQK